jgi:hypothetical protein
MNIRYTSLAFKINDMLDQNTTSTAFTPVSPAERYAKHYHLDSFTR